MNASVNGREHSYPHGNDESHQNTRTLWIRIDFFLVTYVLTPVWPSIWRYWSFFERPVALQLRRDKNLFSGYCVQYFYIWVDWIILFFFYGYIRIYYVRNSSCLFHTRNSRSNAEILFRNIFINSDHVYFATIEQQKGEICTFLFAKLINIQNILSLSPVVDDMVA